MKRCIVNVATDSWVRGQHRLALHVNGEGSHKLLFRDQLPAGCPPHRTRGNSAGLADQCRPYAFKAYALKAAADAGYTSLLWLDASVIPQHSLEPIWQEIETKGYWIPKNGWDNDQWTADSAYPDLFPEYMKPDGYALDTAQAVNRAIPHAVGTAFGIDINHDNGRLFLHEYYRLASTTRAFCGPWQNALAEKVPHRNDDRPSGCCGPERVLGHRHDQTAIAVIAWRLKMELSTNWDFFAYKADPPNPAKDAPVILLAAGV